MTSALAYFAYGFFAALVMVLVAGGIYAFVGRNQSRKITRLERRFGFWHKRRREEPTEKGPPQSGGTTPAS